MVSNNIENQVNEFVDSLAKPSAQEMQMKLLDSELKKQTEELELKKQTDANNFKYAISLLKEN